MMPITNYNHHEGYMKSTACAAYVYPKEGQLHYSMYVSQRGGTKIVSLDLTDAMKVKGATVLQSVVAKATGQSVDGNEPSFVKFHGIGVYAPRWAKIDAPFVLISGGKELRVLDYAKKHVRTLAHTEDGTVAAIGDDAFSGSHKIFKTDLTFQVSCNVLNAQVLPKLVRWKIAKDAIYAKEVKMVKLNTGSASTPWLIKAYKKTAKTLQGVLEKAMICSRPAEEGRQYFLEHCCILKFSRAVKHTKWTEQTDETELF